jgi:hypothetical protein
MVAQRNHLQSMHHKANQSSSGIASLEKAMAFAAQNQLMMDMVMHLVMPTQASPSGLASLEKAMAFGAESQLTMDTEMHLVTARPSLHQTSLRQNQLLFGTHVAFGNHVSQSVVWQNAI